MGSRAVQNFHRRNPSQHRVLATIIDDMNKEGGARPYKLQKVVREIPIHIESVEEQENLMRRQGRPEKKVTWSRELLQVRSISPRQKSRTRDPRTSKMVDAVQSLSRHKGQDNFPACGHFLCQRVGGAGCLQEHQGNLRPGHHQHHLPCSPQMQTVVWRSLPVSRAGLSLDLGGSYIQGEGLV